MRTPLSGFYLVCSFTFVFVVRLKLPLWQLDLVLDGGGGGGGDSEEGHLDPGGRLPGVLCTQHWTLGTGLQAEVGSGDR